VTRLPVGPEGALYVGVFTGLGGAVARFDRAGNFLGYFIPPQLGTPMPLALAFGPDGDLYVIGGSAVIRFDGRTASLKDLVGLVAPQFMAFGADGNLYISDPSTRSVSRYNPGTRVLSQFVTVLGFPAGVRLDPTGNLYVVDNVEIPDPNVPGQLLHVGQVELYTPNGITE